MDGSPPPAAAISLGRLLGRRFAEWIEELRERTFTSLCPFEPTPTAGRADDRLRADPDGGVPQSSAEARLNRAGRGGTMRAVRNQYGLPVIDRFTGMPLEERVPRDLVIRNLRRVKEAATSKKGEKRDWLRNADGSFVQVVRRGPVLHATDTVRLIMQPIRLNEHHWEE